MKPFYLVREGTERIAEGVEFDNGSCALTWMGDLSSVAVYASMQELILIHSKAKIYYEGDIKPDGDEPDELIEFLRDLSDKQKALDMQAEPPPTQHDAVADLISRSKVQFNLTNQINIDPATINRLERHSQALQEIERVLTASDLGHTRMVQEIESVVLEALHAVDAEPGVEHMPDEELARLERLAAAQGRVEVEEEYDYYGLDEDVDPYA